MRYWYRTDSGNLTAEVTNQPVKGHSEYAQTPDLTDIPGPIACCRWNGVAVVVDAARLAEYKALLRQKIEENAFLAVQESVMTTPWGDFRVRRDDIDAYQMIAFSAIYSLQTSTAFSATLRRANDTSVSVTALQFMQFMNLVGERMAAKITLRDSKLNQLAAATASDLKGFVP
jgi:hypothetical protein